MTTLPFAAAAPPTYAPAVAGPRRASRLQSETVRFVLFVAAHAVLALVMYRFRLLAFAQGVVAVSAALWLAYRMGARGALAGAAYVAGCDVLWRVCSSPFPYEGGKYGVALVCAVGLVREGRRVRWDVLSLVYLLAHLPSALATMWDPLSGDTEYRAGLLRAYLSGPVSLAMTAWLCSQVRLTRTEFRRVLAAFAIPTVSVAVVTLFATYTAVNLEFTGESNLATSGGFGPNQVSTALGLGTLVALLLAVRPGTSAAYRTFAFVLAGLCAMQSAMTFSRGGLYAAILALVAGSWWFLRHRGTRRALTLATATAGVLGALVIVPRLDSFTGGALSARFESTNTTNRGTLMLDDVRIWLEHPVLGVGPGVVREYRAEATGAGHTEFTRLLAEHGVFGVVALLALGGMFLRASSAGVRAEAVHDRGSRLSLAAWGALSMIHAAMRLSVVGFTIGLSQVRIVADEPSAPEGWR